MAVIVSAVDTTADLAQPPVRVAAVGTAIGERQSPGTRAPSPTCPRSSARRPTCGRGTDLTPADVDVAELYDGFTFNCLSWLEALGVLRGR